MTVTGGVHQRSRVVVRAALVRFENWQGGDGGGWDVESSAGSEACALGIAGGGASKEVGDVLARQLCGEG
jgi:hypothetical protein